MGGGGGGGGIDILSRFSSVARNRKGFGTSAHQPRGDKLPRPKHVSHLTTPLTNGFFDRASHFLFPFQEL